MLRQVERNDKTTLISFFLCKLSGLRVNYVRPFPCLPSGEMDIRVLILLWTGDYPAQHEVGKFIKHGVMPCRRDKLKGKLYPLGGYDVLLIKSTN